MAAGVTATAKRIRQNVIRFAAGTGCPREPRRFPALRPLPRTWASTSRGTGCSLAGTLSRCTDACLGPTLTSRLLGLDAGKRSSTVTGPCGNALQHEPQSARSTADRFRIRFQSAIARVSVKSIASSLSVKNIGCSLMGRKAQIALANVVTLRDVSLGGGARRHRPDPHGVSWPFGAQGTAVGVKTNAVFAGCTRSLLILRSAKAPQRGCVGRHRN